VTAQRRAHRLAARGRQLPLDLVEVAFVGQLRGVQLAAAVLGDGVAVVQKLVPGPQSADPVAGVDAVQDRREIALNLIPIVVDQVKGAVSFKACSESTMFPQC
jgi:hypothetical protein